MLHKIASVLSKVSLFVCFFLVGCTSNMPMQTPKQTARTTVSIVQTSSEATTTATSRLPTKLPFSPLYSSTAMSGISSTSVPSPTPHTDLQVYRGANVYGSEYPDWEILYDPEVWLPENINQLAGQKLAHREIDGCKVRLDAGPLGATKLAETTITGRKWSISGVSGCNLQYVTGWQGVGYFLGIYFPEECELDQIVSCLVEAEEVFDTFSIVEE